MSAIVEKVQKAIESTTCNVGKWSVTEYCGDALLIWEASADELPPSMRGDEPFVAWGGNQILEQVCDSLAVLTVMDEPLGNDGESRWVLLGQRSEKMSCI